MNDAQKQRIGNLSLISALFVIRGLPEIESSEDLDELIINSVSSAINIESTVIQTLDELERRMS
jgi:hypothetical protein